MSACETEDTTSTQPPVELPGVRVIERQLFDKVLAIVTTGLIGRQGSTGGWHLAGPLAPAQVSRLPGRRRTDKKLLEQRAIHALPRLLGWEPRGEEHFRATQRIQRQVHEMKGDLPSIEALLLAQLELEGFQVTADRQD